MRARPFVPAVQKIQGCRCDGGFGGQDCSQRKCPLGDDPLTVPTATDGDKWTVTLTSSATGTEEYVESFFLEIVDLYGTTHRSRTLTINSTADVLDELNLATRFMYLLLDVPAIQSLINTNATFSGTDNTVCTLGFALVSHSLPSRCVCVVVALPRRSCVCGVCALGSCLCVCVCSGSPLAWPRCA